LSGDKKGKKCFEVSSKADASTRPVVSWTVINLSFRGIYAN